MKQITSLIVLILNFAQFISCSDELLLENDRIVGGDYAKQSQFPYLASIQVKFSSDDFQHYCGGGILSRKWILTAAHCLKYPIGFYQVVIGITKLNEESVQRQIRPIHRVVTHQNFSMKNDYHLALYDFGLVKVFGDLYLSEDNQVLRLPKNGLQPIGNALVAGWGSVDRTGNRYKLKLQFIDIDIPNQSKCERYYPEYENEVHFCVCPAQKKGTCNGDHGSPLVQNDTVVGIVSGTSYPCAFRSPTIYAKISSVVNFIKMYVTDAKM